MHVCANYLHTVHARVIRVHVLKGEAGHWHAPVTRLARLGPAQLCRLARSSPQKKNYFKKNLSFL